MPLKPAWPLNNGLIFISFCDKTKNKKKITMEATTRPKKIQQEGEIKYCCNYTIRSRI